MTAGEEEWEDMLLDPRDKLVRLKGGVTGVDVGCGYGLYVQVNTSELRLGQIDKSPDAAPPWPEVLRPGTHDAFLARMVIGTLAAMGHLVD